MPVLKNTRWEKFAQGLAKGLVCERAYEEAGFKPSRQNAHRLLTTNEDIRVRVEELSERAAEKAEWTAADRLATLRKIAEMHSDNDGDHRVVISAIGEANKMQGSHAPARHEVAGEGGGPVQVIISGRDQDVL